MSSRNPFRRIAIGAGVLCLAATAVASPISLKEIQFLIRQGNSEAEIIREVGTRRMLTALDAAAVAALKESGARDSLIAKLNVPAMVMNPAEAQAEMRRQNENRARMEESLAEDEARRQARDQQWRQAAEQLKEAHTVQGWLEGKLFTIDRQLLKPFDMRTISNTRIFGFYFAAMGSTPCRDFTPQLVEAYARLKKQYGNDFELVLVSRDRDEFNQMEFMRTFRVAWPTLKIGPVDQSIAQFGGDRLPWFVLVSDTGKAMTINAVNKQFVEPIDILRGLEQLLERMSH